ncbi:MAG: hypothetical protein ABIJ08_01590 [Nanoarchaeota archaeon]
MKRIILLIFFILMLSTVSAYDLINIEKTFVDNGDINAYVVVADKGSSSDVLAQLDVITYLSRFSDGPATGIAKLESEVSNIYSRNMITIGNPCVNNITKELMDYKGDCVFEKGLIKFYNKNGKVQLVIYGFSDKSTRSAAKSLSENEFEGKEKIIEPDSEELKKIEKERQMTELLAKTQKEEVSEKVVEEEPEQVIDAAPIEESEVEVIEEPKGIGHSIINFFKQIPNFFRRLFTL